MRWKQKESSYREKVEAVTEGKMDTVPKFRVYVIQRQAYIGKCNVQRA